MFPGNPPQFKPSLSEERSIVGELALEKGGKCEAGLEGATIYARQVLYSLAHVNGVPEFSPIPFGVYFDHPVSPFPIWLDQAQILDTSPINSDLSFRLQWKEISRLRPYFKAWTISNNQKSYIAAHRFIQLYINKVVNNVLYIYELEPEPLLQLSGDNSIDVGIINLKACFPFIGG